MWNKIQYKKLPDKGGNKSKSQRNHRVSRGLYQIKNCNAITFAIHFFRMKNLLAKNN